jgi:hypothetical protein
MSSENLYHVKRSCIDLKDPKELHWKVAIPTTYTNLHAAKESSKQALVKEGYSQSDFVKYEVNNGQKGWAYGSHVIVVAEGPSGETFTVEIETMPNTADLTGDADGKVVEKLYHVVQTNIDYNWDRSGSKRETNIEGSYTNLDEAKKRALTTLLDDDVRKEDFLDYKEYVQCGTSPFGPDNLVHAIKNNGENNLVSIISSP